jgi:hypothetical protein
MAYGELYGGPTTQHEGYAVSGKGPQDGETFGVDLHDHKHKPTREPKVGRKRELRDHERGIGAGIKVHRKRMSMQAAPDHGDHYE